MAVGVWNFVGAGVFGFLINLPIVSYFEIGHDAHGQSRARGHVRRLRHARARASSSSACGRMQTDAGLERDRSGSFGWASGALNVGLGLDDPARPLPGRRAPALGRPSPTATGTPAGSTFLMSGTFHTLEWVRIGARHGLPPGRRPAHRARCVTEHLETRPRAGGVGARARGGRLPLAQRGPGRCAARALSDVSLQQPAHLAAGCSRLILAARMKSLRDSPWIRWVTRTRRTLSYEMVMSGW